MSVFEKQPAEPQSALAEAAGLRWLGEASKAVVRVEHADATRICTEGVQIVSADPQAARQAGVELARIHAAGADAYGCPPPGWDGPNYIGTQQQSCIPTSDWNSFYIEQRVLPFVKAAKDRGNLRSTARIERACALIQQSPELAPQQPARIHGDLWAGNLLFGAQGPKFIDPAAHGGHPLTDLAMLELFGAPYLKEIWVGYREHNDLDALDASLIPIHQLHPVAVHAVTHGPAYGDHLEQLAQATIALLGG
ncbi:fructosamine kinase family protein [Corynebacterium pelargi]|uniref:Fructosamine kinase n=1 Tax=Corynebacterium pelargi TaxID=1471400 RepID=A0A410W722_9CORY|nr:fructosamine kinase family protein [Corynebacterium pelargi]QAU51772.1 Fructosamine kinase [Corynebacterium pelargi]GGG72589.1 fructosamine kinase [Corynebacterium pelargi]